MIASRFPTAVLEFRPDAVERRSIRCRGALIVWVLPALAVLAGATYWLLTASSSRPSSPKPVVLTLSRTAPNSTPSNASRSVDSQGSDQPPVQPLTQGIKTASPVEHSKLASGSNVNAKLSGTKPLVNQSGAEIEAALVGEWTGYYQGQRTLKVSADGRGKMVAHPEGLAATLLAAKLSFEIRWEVNGDKLEFETVGGEPLDKVNVVVKMYGRNRSHQILELQADKMVLLDEDGVTKYVWNRVTSEPRAATAPAK